MTSRESPPIRRSFAPIVDLETRKSTESSRGADAFGTVAADRVISGIERLKFALRRRRRARPEIVASMALPPW